MNRPSATIDFSADIAGEEKTAALVTLLGALKRLDYRFVTPTPATHRRVIGRATMQTARDLRDILGWSLPFAPSAAPPEILRLMRDAGIVTERQGLLCSTVRVSSLGGELFLHSAFPPSAADAVFFGPDSYRFANFLKAELTSAEGGGVLLDIGTGSGVGAIVAARLMRPDRVVMTDVNPAALALAKANAAAAGVAAEFELTKGLDGAPGAIDLIVANPPFMAGSGDRTYRDGGDMHGARLSLDWVAASVDRLAPNGLLLLYTGSAIVDGEDPFRRLVEDSLEGRPFELRYQELDPDIFGGQLSAPEYGDVERIAAVGIALRRLS